ncbi:pseudaminic acid synthase [uncultured Thermosynechococcus sp.]|uniref:pseudaminic acid synthase n=1 Tax=uncultured Thermosynechococcus sp. TaxID=436945 RepID=UPI0026180E21|nr:pseudaminic acid synthase [uncultured Thermosynechococcus sp.]
MILSWNKQQPFIIAEMSGNHNQSLENALKIVEAVAQSGAHGLKLQTYTADTMTVNCNKDSFFIADESSLWKGEYLYSLYQKAYTPWEWHEPIFKRARELGLIAFSTPFDLTAVDFLEELDCPIYKIASFENVDLRLVKRVAETGKPVIMSTGMATLAELDEAVRTIRETGNDQITLLKCTSTYPADPRDSNLRTIPHLKELFGCEVGLSDHTLGIGVAVAAVALGATVIEKHFTLSRAEGGVDAAFSLEPHEMKLLVEETQRAYQALGKVHYGPTESEKKSLVYRRSLYFVKDMAAGDVITEECIRSIRPGYGLPPKYYDVLLGKQVNQAVERGTAVSWAHIG